MSFKADMVYKHTADVSVKVKLGYSALTLSKSLNNRRLLVLTIQMNKTGKKAFLDLTVHVILIRERSSFSICMSVRVLPSCIASLPGNGCK